MATCPLCSTRSSKRYCPAKGEQICALCCGTKREIEIDCPSNCTYLRAGRDYEAEKRIPDPELVARSYRFDERFLNENVALLNFVSMLVIVERQRSPWLVDNDVIEVYKALST